MDIILDKFYDNIYKPGPILKFNSQQSSPLRKIGSNIYANCRNKSAFKKLYSLIRRCRLQKHDILK
jgi:hypothetical protein